MQTADKLRATRDFVAAYSNVRFVVDQANMNIVVHRDDPRSNKTPEHVAGCARNLLLWLNV